MNYTYPVLLLLILSIPACKGPGTKDTPVNTASVDSTSISVSKKANTEVENIQSRIVFLLGEIRRLRAENIGDSLERANRVLLDYIKQQCVAHPELLNADFEDYNIRGMSVVTSDDRNFRIYSWDTEMGGTMHFYNAIVNYRTNSGCKFYILNDVTRSPEDGGAMYDTVYTVTTNSNKVYYLVTYFAFMSSAYQLTGIKAFAVENHKLDLSAKLFRTNSKSVSDLSFDFWSHSGDLESTDNHITLTTDKRVLSIPKTGSLQTITDTSYIYKFNGQQFVFDKITL